MTTEYKETNQIYMKCYRHGNKTLLEATKIQQSRLLSAN